MAEATKAATRGRPPVATLEEYFAVAFELLSREGFGALSVASIVARLGVTKGSFYHHFKNWDDFVWRLLARWEQAQTDRIMDLTDQAPDPYERLHLLKRLAAEIPHATESALRAWGQSNPIVGSAMERIDARRLVFVSRVCGDYVGDPERGKLFATGVMTMTIGLQSMSRNAPSEAFFDLYTIVDTAMDVERER